MSGTSERNNRAWGWLFGVVGFVATTAVTLLLVWASAVGGRVEANRDDIGDLGRAQAVVETRLEYMESALRRIETKLGTAPAKE